MKKAKWILTLLIILALMGCADSGGSSGDDAADTGETGDTGDTTGITVPTEATETEITKINLSGLNNLVISSDSSTSARRSFYGSASGSVKRLTTVVGGQLQEVTMNGGESLEINVIRKVEGGTRYKTFFEFTDASGDTKRYMADAEGNTVVANFNPQKSSNLGNAEYLQELGGKIYYRTGNKELRVLSVPSQSGKMLSTAGDSTGDALIAEGVEQFAIHSNGEMILDDGSAVNYRQSDETLNDLDAPYTDETYGDNWDADASVNHFFLTHGDGFMVKRAIGMPSNNDFVRYYTKDGEVRAQSAQENDFIRRYKNGENFPWPNATTTASMDQCDKYTVQSKEVVICKPSEIFILGDATTDIEKKNYNYATHAIYGLQIVASSNYLYMYSENSEGGDPRKLSREDIFNEVSTDLVTVNATIPQTIDYKIAAGTLEVSTDDTVSFCGTKGGQMYAVQIAGADTATPAITEAPGECESITPLD